MELPVLMILFMEKIMVNVLNDYFYYDATVYSDNLLGL